MRIEDQLHGVRRCPHCSVANPVLRRVYFSDQWLSRGDGGSPSKWAVYHCTSCGSLVAAKGAPGDGATNPHVVAIFPEAKDAHEALPEPARRYLQQAFETRHAPDACAVMAAAAVDAMLKNLGYVDGSLYERIDKAVADNVLTKRMAQWAHSVRLEANRPRHADKEEPHVSHEDATRSLEFAEALGTFLFVLQAKADSA